MKISSITKAELITLIVAEMELDNMQCFIETNKTLLHEYVPAGFPKATDGDEKRTWFDYLSVQYTNEEKVFFAIVFNDFGSRTARNYPSSEQFYQFINHFCESPNYYNLYTRSEATDKVLSEYL